MVEVTCEGCTSPGALYIRDCMDCRARMLANSPQFWQSKREGRLSTAYQQALKLNGLTHEAVKQAAERMGR